MNVTSTRARTRGVAALELAVALPFVLLLVLGVMEYALQFHALHVMTDAAREGARTMAVRGGTAAEATAATAECLPNFGGATFTVTATQNGRDVVVDVSVPREQLSLGLANLITLTPSTTLNAQVTMRKEGG